MKKLFVLSIVAVLTGVSMAQAETSVNAGANAGATAQSGNASSKNYSFGTAVGAADCANAIGLGPVAGSWTDKTCKHERVASYWAKRGNFAMADQVMLNEPISAKAHQQLTAETQRVSQSNAVPAASSLQVKIAGDIYTLSGDTLARYEACGNIATSSGVKFRKPGC